MCRFSFNPYYRAEPNWDSPPFDFIKNYDALPFHKSLEGYSPTPLVSLPDLAGKLGVGTLYVKDESLRFGVKAFKPLGASFAIFQFLKREWEARMQTPFTADHFRDQAALAKLGTYTFCAATDGNHGRAVAWTARMLGQKAVIYMPAGASRARIENIEGEGARVETVPGTFDDCVRKCGQDARRNGWQEIADTAYQGYMEYPKFILLGYQTIFKELEDSLHLPDSPTVDLVILPAGVGGLAAAGASYYVRKYGAGRPRLVCVEPDDADCFLESILHGNGNPLASKGKLESLMVGLACGIPSLVAWPIIRDAVDLFLAIPDHYALDAMREYHGQGIVSGESGAAGLAALLALTGNTGLKAAREKLGLDSNSRVLLINTEGDTDPQAYRRIIQSEALDNNS